MKKYTQKTQAAIDALEFAINQICWDIDQGTLHDGPIAHTAIHQLQTIKNTVAVFSTPDASEPMITEGT